MLKRALRLGFSTIDDRWDRDSSFRESLAATGRDRQWTVEQQSLAVNPPAQTTRTRYLIHNSAEESDYVWSEKGWVSARANPEVILGAMEKVRQQKQKQEQPSSSSSSSQWRSRDDEWWRGSWWQRW